MLPDKFAFVDIETTGTSATRDRIIEIGILRVENGKIVSKYKQLINPQTYMSPFIEKMTGIKPEDLEKAPAFYSVKNEILELLKDAVFVAHNVHFDYGFLKSEFRRLDINFSAKTFCTVKLSKMLFPKYRRHNLDSVIERFNIKCKNRHRAFDDAKVLWEFFKIVKATFDEEKISKTFNFILKKTSLPSNLDKEIVESLPDAPGVYIFYGQNKMPLYIGKSVNIKERVLSHFSSRNQSSIEMKIVQQIQDIKFIKTAGELEALLEESSLIKKMQPIYNRKLRIKRNLVLIKKNTNTNGFDTVDVELVDEINALELENILGIFKSKKQATDYLKFVAKEYNLCEKILGIEKSSRYCFGYHLKQCFGACCGEERPIKYNMRFIMAFSDTRIKPWPFKGPIMIEEENQIDKFKTGYVIDKWCILKRLRTDDSYDEVNSLEYLFDLDAYKILFQYLNNSKNSKKVKLLNYDMVYSGTRLRILD